MSSLPAETARRAEQRLSDTLLSSAAYIAVAAGYLTSLLVSGHFGVAGFVLLTLSSVGWIWLFRRIVTCPEPLSQLPVWLPAGLIAMTVVALASPWLGTGLDWLLPVVTVAVLAVGYPWRRAILFGLGLWLVTALNVAALDGIGSTLTDVYMLQNQLSLAVGFAFVFAFSLVYRLQMDQRARAEALVAELEAAHAQLRASASEAQELAITRERNHMAREIHDTLGHYLTILTVKLETAIKLEEHDPHADTRLRDELVEARRVATECLAEVRRSVAALRPADTSATQLADALTRLIAEFEGAAPDVETALDVEGPVQALAPELRAALYRCAQEALTNVRRHAHASKVLVRLRVDERQTELTVLDNGSGPDGDGRGQQDGFGLLGMRERIELVGGTVRAGPEPERGWRVAVVVPLTQAAGAGADLPRLSTPVEG